MTLWGPHAVSAVRAHLPPDCPDDCLVRSLLCPSCMERRLQPCFHPMRLSEPASLVCLQVNHQFGGFDLLSLNPKSQGLEIKIMHKSFLIPVWMAIDVGGKYVILQKLGGKVRWYFYVRPVFKNIIAFRSCYCLSI